MQQTNNIQSPKKWYLRWWAIIIWAVLALVLVFFIAMSFYVISKSKAGNNAPNVKKSQPYDKKSYEGSTNFSQGPKNAEINIVEFGDFACSHTKNSFYTMKKILSTHKNIRLVFRDYPNVAEQSLDLAIAARCAGEQKLFWQMHDKLFQNQGVTEQSKITDLAVSVGVDRTLYEQCVTSQAPAYAIRNDFTAAEKLGVQGTPTWFVNGQIVEGDAPLETWEKIINDLK